MTENSTINSAYQRKKQPEVVRQQILDTAIKLWSGQTIQGPSFDVIAREVNITKGGVMHHFPTKQALLEALFNVLMMRIDQRISDLMASDPDAQGRFSRAYLEVITTLADSPDGQLCDILTIVALSDAILSERWKNWMKQHLHKHTDTDSSINTQIVLFAADGLWLSDHITDPAERQALIKQLKDMTYQV